MNQVLWPGWETVGLIGRGSFGAVYEIRRNVLGNVEKAALKVISIPQNSSDIDEMYNDGYDSESITSTFQAHLKSIVAEYALMRKMNGSSNIVNCDDVRYVQHDDGIGWDIYIKMELLTPLAKALPARIPEEMVIQLARDMCAALNLCQKHGIVHRDIKPQNIFISDNGDYKLGDFGVAKTVEKTTGGTKIGTYKYMAPEVYNNQPYGVGADIYSLGLVLYWMLNERRMPFLPLPPEKLRAGMDEAARNRRLAGDQFGPPKNGNPILKRIVMKACAFDPSLRYHSAQELLNDLDQMQSDPTVGMFAGGTVAVKRTAVEQNSTHDDGTVGMFGNYGTAGFRQSENTATASGQTVEPGTSATVAPKQNTPVDDDPNQKKKKSKVGLIIGGILAAIILVILLLLRSCDGRPVDLPDDDDSPGIATTDPGLHEDEEEESYEMSIAQEKLELAVGASVQLTVIGIPEDAEIKWSSDDKSVAIVDEDGMVTGIAEGEATITAQWKNKRKTYEASTAVTVKSSGIILNSYVLELTYIGQTAVLEGTTYPEGETITWTSSNENVVTVSADGTVTVVDEGEAVITASFGTCKAECAVTVSLPSISFPQSDVSLLLGESTSLKVEVKPEGTPVTWTSSDENVVKVDNGEVTAVGAGTATVTAKIICDGVPYQKTCRVTVSTPSVSLSSASLTLMPGQIKDLSAITKPDGLQVTWSSDKTAVATVNGGKVTAVAPGTAKICAQITYGGKNYTASCTVTVSTPSISLNFSDATIAVGDSITLKATTKPDGQQITWTSSNTNVATVSNGKVTAVASGTAKITAKMTYSGKTYEASCSVTVSAPTIEVTSSANTIEFSERDQGTAKLTATVKPDNGKIEWSISDSGVASLSANGFTATVTAKAAGSVRVTATYTVNGKQVQDYCDLTVKKAASTLTVSNINYPKYGTLEDFAFTADVSSNYQLTKFVISGTAKSNALGISVDGPTDTYTFVEGIYELGATETASITRFLVSRVEDLYNLYVAAADLLGADHSMTITLHGTLMDSSGAQFSMTITYVLDEK